MSIYALTHLSDRTLLHDLAALVARDRTTTAALLAHLAEVDQRRLYAAPGHSSMHDYCVRALRMSEETAYKRIQAARAARKFPAIFTAVAQGRLHLTAVVMLAPHLTPDNAAELLATAELKSKAELEGLLAQRFPRPDLPARVEPIPASPARLDPDPVAPVDRLDPDPAAPVDRLDPDPVDRPVPAQHGPGPVVSSVPHPRMAPLAPQRFAVQFTIGQEMHDKLRYAQALLRHQIPSGNIAEVIDRALDELIPVLERRKFAATDTPRPGRRRAPGGRSIPAEVKRAVWKRDGGRCSFVSDGGQRCPAREFLEFDHREPVARGGEATIGQVRLLCRIHNQYAAERAFGTDFMNRKRQEAQHA